MEITTQAPTGTRLRIDADRQFEGQTGDSVLRIQGERQEGGQVFDATYVEIDQQEAKVVGKLVRSLRQPEQDILDTIAQEVQATFGSRLGGRDAQQIAQIVHRAWWLNLAQGFGADEDERKMRLNSVAERFERAASQKRAAFAGGQQPGNGQQYGQEQGQQHQQRQSGR